MNYKDIFHYTDISVNDNGHVRYNNCVFTKDFGLWKQGDKLNYINSYGNLFLYLDTNSIQGKVFYQTCVMLVRINEQPSGTVYDCVGGIINLYCWKDDDMLEDVEIDI